jgi:RNase P subunit RPR2
MSTTTGSPQAPPYICGKCKQVLVLGRVMASYLGSEFPVELWKCPGCGKVFVPEPLATGKMLRVEQALEDK